MARCSAQALRFSKFVDGITVYTCLITLAYVTLNMTCLWFLRSVAAIAFDDTLITLAYVINRYDVSIRSISQKRRLQRK
jgi:hypothetical protein